MGEVKGRSWPALSVLSKCLRELAGGQNPSFVYQPGLWLEETIFGMKFLKGQNVLEICSLASSIGGLSIFLILLLSFSCAEKCLRGCV